MRVCFGCITWGAFMLLEIALYHRINPLRYKQSKTFSEIFYMISCALLFGIGIVWCILSFVTTFLDVNEYVFWVDILTDIIFHSRSAILWKFCVNELNGQKQLKSLGKYGNHWNLEELSQEIAKTLGRLDVVSKEDMARIVVQP